MSRKNQNLTAQEIRNWVIGIIMGVALSVAFLITGNPGLIGVGIAIGTGLAIALNSSNNS
jgi:hypothetical protein